MSEISDAPTDTLPIAAGGAFARPGGTCRSCSTPLAADQRYCLGCGARVAAPRVEWAAALGGAAAGGAAPAAQAAGASGAGRWALMLDRVGGPMGAAAVVLVALGVGFLLGQGGNAPSGPATIVQRPPIVNVQGGGLAPAATSSAGTLAGSGSGSKQSKQGGSTAGIPKAGNDTAGGNLNRLRAQPDQQATGGTAPRRDHKASGGGSSTETIG
jgi:hypothetical protein